jgi:parvulin-like peptidyl-prolyl isomerase
LGSALIITKANFVRFHLRRDGIRAIIRRRTSNLSNDIFAGGRFDGKGSRNFQGFAPVVKGDPAKTALIERIASVAFGDLAMTPSPKKFFICTPCLRAAFIGLILLLAAGSGCRQSNESVLAIVGKRTVTATAFTERLIEARTRMNLPDNGQVRKEVLRMMVEDELLIAEAARRGYADDAEGRHEKQRLEIQELLDGYFKDRVGSRIRVTEEDMRTLYGRLNTKVKARHLYAPTIRRADSLHAVLMAGATFEKLAREVFSDPRLADTGGSLGTFTADEMDPAFEEAAFTMAVGRISRPIRTAQGYSILQVEDRVVRPLLTETEYARHKPGLERLCLMRKQKLAVQAHVDSLRRLLDITFNRPVMAELLGQIRNRPLDQPIETDPVNGTDPVTGTGGDFRPAGTDTLSGLELVRWNSGGWTVAEFNRRAEFTGSEQRKWVRSIESLEDFTAGLVVRESMLSAAKKAGLHKTSAFRSAVRRKTEDFLLKRLDRAIQDETVIPEAALRARFKAEGARLAAPPRIRLVQILPKDKAEADEVGRRLRHGIRFDALAREFAVRQGSGDPSGGIGEFTRSDLGPAADRLFALEPGEWTGPMRIGSRYAFFKCDGKTSERPLAYDEARPMLIEGLRPEWRDKTRKALLASAATRVRVVTYPERLQSVRTDAPAGGRSLRP